MKLPLRGAGVISGHWLKQNALEGAWAWVAVPLVIIYILGISMHGLFSRDFTPARPYAVAVAGEGAGKEALLRALESRPELFGVALMDEEAARRSVLSQEADAAVIVPASYPEEPVVVVAPPGTVVQGVVAGTVEAVLRSEAAAGDGEEATGAGGQAGDFAGAIAGEANGAGPIEADAATNASQGGAPWLGAGSFDYYAVGLTVMFLMYTIHGSMTRSARDRATGAYARIRSLGVSRSAYLAAGYLSSVANGVLFALAMAVLTRLLYGVEWGNPAAWAAVTVAGAASLAAVSFLISAAMPANPKSLDNAGGTLYTILAFLGGSTVPLAVLPDWFADALAWLPNRIALEGYFKAMAGGGLADVTSGALTLSAVALLLVAAGWSISTVRSGREG